MAEQPPAPKPSRSPVLSLIVIGVALAVVIIAALIIVFVPRGDDKKQTTQAGGPTAGGGPAASATAAANGCKTPTGGSKTIPESGPQATWNLVGKVAAPTAKQYGPAATKSGLHQCFAHNPTGALFATAYVIADASNPKISPALFYGQRISPASPERDALVKLAKTSGQAQAPTGPVLQIRGFRIDNSKADSASVTLATGTGDSDASMAALSYDLQWNDGDWYIQVTGDPETWLNNRAKPLGSMAGFVPWSGV